MKRQFRKIVNWKFKEQGQYALGLLVCLIIGFVWGNIFNNPSDNGLVFLVGSMFSVWVIISIIFVFINVKRKVYYEEIK